MKFETVNYNFKLRIGFKTITSFNFTLLTFNDFISSINQETGSVAEPSDIEENYDGVLLKDKKINEQINRLKIGKFIRYIPYIYNHCYIDLNSGFDNYKKKFSSKSLATIKRKINKCKKDGVIDVKPYRAPEEIKNFFKFAVPLSQSTYQEKLLDAGLPSDDAFLAKSIELAEQDELRAYILFIEDKAVAYLYCPAKNGVLLYSYLGYHPDYAHLSPGTVLQWLALESMFSENKFSIFDFTEGESPHKKYFATHTKLCADVFFFKKRIRSFLAVFSHLLLESIIKLAKLILRKR